MFLFNKPEWLGKKKTICWAGTIVELLSINITLTCFQLKKVKSWMNASVTKPQQTLQCTWTTSSCGDVKVSDLASSHFTSPHSSSEDFLELMCTQTHSHTCMHKLTHIEKRECHSVLTKLSSQVSRSKHTQHSPSTLFPHNSQQPKGQEWLRRGVLWWAKTTQRQQAKQCLHFASTPLPSPLPQWLISEDRADAEENPFRTQGETLT